jgi:hypothetical protein
MGRSIVSRAATLGFLLLLFLPGCEPTPRPLGTSELREALFDSILDRTAGRTAFSQPKQVALAFDPLEAMEELRGAVAHAATEDELFYALVRMSNARRDRHLSVALVPGGLEPSFTDGLEAWGLPDPPEPRVAPVRIRPDYGGGGTGYFLADRAAQAGEVEIGARVTRVNGMAMQEFEAAARPYIRHSTRAGFRWKLAEALNLSTALFPPALRGDSLVLGLVGSDGTERTLSLPYLAPGEPDWDGASEPDYRGFALAWATPTFDLYLPTDGRRLVLLRWHRFESSSLVADVNRLVAQGATEGFLDYAVIFDATGSGGGSLGAYAVQRIQPRPFRTTFGTLRISDVTRPFMEEKEAELRAEGALDSGGPEVVDDGTWLLDWLETDLTDALARGDSVTLPVPFKLAHAPKDSDGILQPAPVHFSGPLVVFSGPHGGSHLDQFMSIVADNELGHIIGMPAGGYSNTWEWEEVLTYPGTKQPVVGFMWSIGHTIRPNGEVLEGNPAQVDEWVPVTAENAGQYHDLLFQAALRHLRSVGFEVGG